MQTHVPAAGLPHAESPFDLVLGIPVHPLVVHFAVVLLPLSALALIALVLVPRWRRTFGWVVLAGLFIGTGATFVAKESGEALARRVGTPQEHAEWGDRLPLLAVLLFIVAAAWFWLDRRASRAGDGGRSPLTAVLGIVAIVLALASVALTIVVGHSGAESVWQGRLPAASDTSSGAGASQPTGVPSAGSPTIADVQAHGTPADCWTVVDSTVYDLTDWIARHPGGPRDIEQMCGVDATDAYTAQHGGQGEPTQELQGYEVGPLAPVPAAAGTATSGLTVSYASYRSAVPARRYTMAEVRRHRTSSDCWSVVNRKVYNLTSWIARHPGGSSRILAMCGRDASAAFNAQHGGSSGVASILAAYKIGRLA